MIFKTVSECDLAEASRSSTPNSSRHASFIALPHEILEHVYFLLSIHDRLSLLRSCTVLRDVYAASAALQYDFTLSTTAYLDIPWRPPSPSRETSPVSSEGEEVEELIRPTIPSVSLAPRPKGSGSVTPVRTDLPLSAAEKNEQLIARERRWETLNAACQRTFRIGGPAGVYELQEGIFLMCDDYSDADDGRPTTIRLIPLPSAQDPDLDDPVTTTKSKKLDFSISDLTMDPTQDLIVVSEHRPVPTGSAPQAPTHRFHLLTLSSFEPHPLAASAALDFPPFTNSVMQTRQLLQVMGDVLVVLVSKYAAHWFLAGLAAGLAGLNGLGNEEEIVCWNWKTGRVLARLALPENGWFASMAVLGPTSFMVTSTSNVSPPLPSEPHSLASVFPPVIQIYTFMPDPSNTVVPLQPLEADYMDDTTARPVLIAQLELPRFAPGVIISSFDVRPDPAFPSSSTKGVGQHKSFTQNPEKGVLVFEIQVQEPADPDLGLQDQMETVSYELFVLREKLVELAQEGEERLRQQREEGDLLSGYSFWRAVEQTIPWTDWGVVHARMMDISMSRRNWVCSCSGYRFISLVASDSTVDITDDDHHELIPIQPRKCDLRLYDFSPYNIRKPLSFADDHDVEVTVRSAPTVLEKKRIWREDVVSKLVYQEILRKKGVRANGVMIDDQRVIAVCTRGRRNGDWSNIHQEMTVYCM